jgi:hypothetical protein
MGDIAKKFKLKMYLIDIISYINFPFSIKWKYVYKFNNFKISRIPKIFQLVNNN